jgi:O-6-methylguanine DNA methyltransferase
MKALRLTVIGGGSVGMGIAASFAIWGSTGDSAGSRGVAWCWSSAGAPSAPRAAGTATGQNPLSIIIPCHRVVGRNGGLHGYAGADASTKSVVPFWPLLHPTPRRR